MKIEILFREKPVKFLIYLLDTEMQPKTLSAIAKRTDCFYNHIEKLSKKYVEAGLIVKEKKGRDCNLSLTRKGFVVATELKTIFKKLGIDEDGN